MEKFIINVKYALINKSSNKCFTFLDLSNFRNQKTDNPLSKNNSILEMNR